MPKRKSPPSRGPTTRSQPQPKTAVSTATDPTRWPDETPNVTFQNYVVAFFDLLGTRHRLDGLSAAWRRRMHEGHNSSVEQAMLDSARTVAEPITLLRRHFRSFFQGFLKNVAREPVQLGGQPTETLLAFRSASSPKMTVSAFSDSMIVHLPLKDPTSDWLQLRAILCLLHAVGATSSVLAHHGILLRGGIALGCGVELYHKEIYGPVLADAYVLESSVAKVARVVVNEDLLGFLTHVAAQSGTDFRSLYEKKMAARARALLSRQPSEADPVTVDYAKDGALIEYLNAHNPNFVSEATAALTLSRGTAPAPSQGKYDYLIDYISGPLARSLAQTHTKGDPNGQ